MTDVSQRIGADSIMSVRVPKIIQTRIGNCYKLLQYPADLSVLDVIADALEFQAFVMADPSFGVVVLGPDSDFQGCTFERYGSARIEIPANSDYDEARMTMRVPKQAREILSSLSPEDVASLAGSLLVTAVNLFWVCSRHYASGRLPVVMDTNTGTSVLCFERWLDEY